MGPWPCTRGLEPQGLAVCARAHLYHEGVGHVPLIALGRGFKVLLGRLLLSRQTLGSLVLWKARR